MVNLRTFELNPSFLEVGNLGHSVSLATFPADTKHNVHQPTEVWNGTCISLAYNVAGRSQLNFTSGNGSGPLHLYNNEQRAQVTTAVGPWEITELWFMRISPLDHGEEKWARCRFLGCENVSKWMNICDSSDVNQPQGTAETTRGSKCCWQQASQKSN